VNFRPLEKLKRKYVDSQIRAKTIASAKKGLLVIYHLKATGRSAGKIVGLF